MGAGQGGGREVHGLCEGADLPAIPPVLPVQKEARLQGSALARGEEGEEAGLALGVRAEPEVELRHEGKEVQGVRAPQRQPDGQEDAAAARRVGAVRGLRARCDSGRLPGHIRAGGRQGGQPGEGEHPLEGTQGALPGQALLPDNSHTGIRRGLWQGEHRAAALQRGQAQIRARHGHVRHKPVGAGEAQEDNTDKRAACQGGRLRPHQGREGHAVPRPGQSVRGELLVADLFFG